MAENHSAETFPSRAFRGNKRRRKEKKILSAETDGEGKEKKFFPRKQAEKERKKLLLPRRGRRRNEIYFVPIFPIFLRAYESSLNRRCYNMLRPMSHWGSPSI